MKLEHIGIAVKDLHQANLCYEKLLGIASYKMESVSSEGVNTSFFQTGESKLELLEATHFLSPIARFIDKKGEGIHHLAIAVKDIQSNLDELEAKGIQLIDKTPRKGAEGLDIAFLHPKSTHGVLLELCENNNL